VAPAFRRRGLGDEVARALARRSMAVAVPEPDASFFVERGFRRAVQGGDALAAGARAAAPVEGLAALLPPDPLAMIPAVSVALVDPLRRRVLLGRRKTPPYEGWWAFPGGKKAPLEDPRRAAARELAEETGIELHGALAPRLVTPVLAGDGRRVFAIESLAFLVLDVPVPRATVEIDAEWISIDAARALRPTTAGTRLVLARIAELLLGAR
jgi:8-oxo-dGTP pyrophosphatase MutT (NUDIX family)